MLGIQNIGAVSVIKARSSLTGECLQQCEQAVKDCLGSRRMLLVLELAECPLLCSKALEFIVDSQTQCLKRGGRLVVADPQPLCREILHITGIDEHVAVFEDMRSALSEFAR